MFFWEMQAGSDNKTACATCHFKAGEDGRDRNQMNPGANGNWDGSGYGPNYTLIANDFPLTNLPTKDVDNIIGSQGVRLSQFTGFSRSGAETTTPVADPVFNVSGVNVRQVTGKNTPSNINSVFITLKVQSPYQDLQTRQKPTMTLLSTVRLSNCSVAYPATSGTVMGCK